MAKAYKTRKGSRRSVRCDFMYFWNGILDRGTVWDVSESGWRATGPTPIPIGSETTAYLALPNTGDSKYLLVERAQVCWTDGTTVGWKIMDIDPEMHDRLVRYMQKNQKR